MREKIFRILAFPVAMLFLSSLFLAMAGVDISISQVMVSSGLGAYLVFFSLTGSNSPCQYAMQRHFENCNAAGEREKEASYKCQRVLYLAAILVVIVSYLAALAAMISGNQGRAEALGWPALLLSGWAALSHFMTLDDDFPGEWSNQNKDKAIWRKSLIELGLKVLVFAVVGMSIYM